MTVAGFSESIALFVCPMAPEHSRVWFRLAVTDWTADEAKLRAFQHEIFVQDQPILESQFPKRLPLAARAKKHAVADKASVAYRRFLQQQDIRFGVSWDE